jgi:zinc D-Ala-D-Ala carboxypeptidase
MNLSEHFTLEQLTFSEIALRNGIDNTPDADTIENLKVLASALEEVQTLLGHRVWVQSAFRCEELERILTDKAYKVWCAKRGKSVNNVSWKEYFATKGHPQGFSGDITVPEFGTAEAVCKAIQSSSIRYDQLIYEFKSWCHLSVALALRMQVLTLDGDGTRQGIA